MRKVGFCLLIGALFSLCCNANEAYFTETFALGTSVTGQFKTSSEDAAVACYNVMNDEVRRLENLLSAYIDDSDISKLGKNAGSWVEVSKDTYEILNLSKKIAQDTHGAFDPTVGAIVKLWSVDQDNHRVPDTEEIKKMLPYVDFNKIETKIEDTNKYFAKIGANQKITIGAIGKGFIANKVIQKLKEAGCKDSLVSLGGNIIGTGTNAEGKPWSIGLQQPNEERGEYFAVVPIDDSSVVTSGDYEKYFIQDGVKYHHLLDPKTGKPVPATISSVTIVNPDSALADALCTALFVMGWDNAVSYIKAHPELQVVLVDEKLTKVAYSKNLQNIIHDIDPAYSVEIIDGE